MNDATYRITHPAAAEALLDEADFARDERLPYWADLWPSAVALARRLDREDLSGRHAIELGCGVGLPTVVALARGAEVLATDHYKVALDFTRYNARINLDEREPETRLLDWHVPRTEDLKRSFGLVLAADVLYEARNVKALAALIPDLLAPGGEIIFADPGRRWEPLFRDLMRERGFGFETEETIVESEKRGVTVLLHQWSRRT